MWHRPKTLIKKSVLFRPLYDIYDSMILAGTQCLSRAVTFWAIHDDIIKWKHFPRNWPFVRRIHRSRWIPHTKASDAELWCFFFLICVWINLWVNNREAGDLRRHSGHYDVNVIYPGRLMAYNAVSITTLFQHCMFYLFNVCEFWHGNTCVLRWHVYKYSHRHSLGRASLNKVWTEL